LSALTSLQVDAPLSYVIAVIALGVATAGSSDPRIALLIACAAAGAFLGDNLSYLIGRRFGPWAERRFFASGKVRAAGPGPSGPCTDSACR
jgi:membrane protein DedA with SNARE-associated domain